MTLGSRNLYLPPWQLRVDIILIYIRKLFLKSHEDMKNRIFFYQFFLVYTFLHFRYDYDNQIFPKE